MICGKNWGGHGRQLNSAKLIVLRDHYRSHSGSLSVLSVKKANIITESRLFHFVYFHVLYS